MNKPWPPDQRVRSGALHRLWFALAASIAISLKRIADAMSSQGSGMAMGSIGTKLDGRN